VHGISAIAHGIVFIIVLYQCPPEECRLGLAEHLLILVLRPEIAPNQLIISCIASSSFMTGLKHNTTSSEYMDPDAHSLGESGCSKPASATLARTRLMMCITRMN